jgi:hypothetical protein
MPKRKAKGSQLDMLPKSVEALPQHSFNLSKQDQFIQGLGIKLVHYRAMPSPIGLKDRGEYRRSDALDTISENGMIYKECGEFTAVFLGNSKSNNNLEGGIFDQSTARITLPRFYDADSPSHPNEEINLAIGDRVYIKETEVKVINYQRVEYNPNHSDYLQFPALCVEFLMDSRGIEYNEGVHFKIDKNGNIQWKSGQKNPGIDPDTGKGRVYSIRYKYNAHWYIVSIPNEVRMTNITEGDTRKPARMPYQAYIQREYVYHNKARTDQPDQNEKTETPRTIQEPTQSVPVDNYQVRVNISNFEEDE